MLTYVSKKGERSNYPLATALESSIESRFKYFKVILKWQKDLNTLKKS
jgi:hypothetical protein